MIHLKTLHRKSLRMVNSTANTKIIPKYVRASSTLSLNILTQRTKKGLAFGLGPLADINKTTEGGMFTKLISPFHSKTKNNIGFSSFGEPA